MKWKPYPKYKDSGVEWLGEVPEHWRVGPLKRFVMQRPGAIKTGPFGSHLTSTEMTGGAVRVYNQRGVIDGDFSSGEHYISEYKFSQLRAFEAFPGDLLVTTRGTIGRAAVLPLDAERGILHPCLLRVQVDPGVLIARYLRFLIQDSHLLRTQLDLASNATTIDVIYSETMSNLLMAVPPVPEMETIAEFLDRETAKIDTLIAKQERLVELLQEKRQALISHAVTKGLNPAAPMKPSGVEWLGDVPAHWNVLPVKRVLEYVTSGARDWGGRYTDDGSVFLRIGNLTRDGVDLDLSDLQFVSAPAGADTRRTRVRAGDVVVSITADLGSVAWIPKQVEGGYVSQHLALCRPKGVINSRWLAYALRSDAGTTQLLLSGYGGTKIQLSLCDVREPLVALPPAWEQERIVEHLDLRLTQMERLVGKANRSIALMREHRTALISAAVTGKIDVRDLSHA